MFAVFLAAAASSRDFPPCLATITTDLFTRCSLTDHLTLNGTSGASTLYVHNGRVSPANVTLPDNSSYSVRPGEGLQVLLSPSHSRLSVQCADCLLTVWHTPSLSHVNASFVSDAAGAVINGTSVTLARDYIAYFDFGDTTRFRIYGLVHRRERPLVVFRQSGDSIESVEAQKGVDINITGPGIFKLASSQFLVTTFRFVVGSTVKIPTEFSNRPATGTFALWQDGAITRASGLSEGFIHPADEHQTWSVLAWVMVGLAVAIFVASIGSIFWLGFAQFREFCSHGKAKPQDRDTSLMAG